jgi:putative Holliday junction resolvase
VRLLCLDLGEKRIGVAVGDDQNGLAFPDRVLTRRSAKQDRQAIAQLTREHEAGTVVVGLPLALDGSDNPNAQRARSFAEYLSRVITVPVVLWDERLTTVEATERLAGAGMTGARQKGLVDAVSAAVILEDFMRERTA